MYIIIQLDLKYGEHELFIETMPKLQKIVEAAPKGPRLLCGFLSTAGQLFRVIHIWETETADGFFGAMNHVMSDASFPEVMNKLKQACFQEVLMFAEQTPYSPGLIGR
jgi:hypothetical protein